MDERRLKTGLSVAWVTLGAVQTVTGLARSEPLFAVLGGIYALLGVAYYWAEVWRERGA